MRGIWYITDRLLWITSEYNTSKRFMSKVSPNVGSVVAGCVPHLGSWFFTPLFMPTGSGWCWWSHGRCPAYETLIPATHRILRSWPAWRPAEFQQEWGKDPFPFFLSLMFLLCCLTQFNGYSDFFSFLQINQWGNGPGAESQWQFLPSIWNSLSLQKMIILTCDQASLTSLLHMIFFGPK